MMATIRYIMTMRDDITQRWKCAVPQGGDWFVIHDQGGGVRPTAMMHVCVRTTTQHDKQSAVQ